jgi:hypothetical protein
VSARLAGARSTHAARRGCATTTARPPPMTRVPPPNAAGSTGIRSNSFGFLAAVRATCGPESQVRRAAPRRDYRASTKQERTGVADRRRSTASNSRVARCGVKRGSAFKGAYKLQRPWCAPVSLAVQPVQRGHQGGVRCQETPAAGRGRSPAQPGRHISTRRSGTQRWRSSRS